MSLDLLAYEHTLLESMTDKQKMLYLSEINNRKKDKTLAVILALLLGSIGAHHFYLGRYGWGILYIICSPLLLPLIASVIECFGFIQKRVDHRNKDIMSEVAQRVKVITETTTKE